LQSPNNITHFLASLHLSTRRELETEAFYYACAEALVTFLEQQRASGADIATSMDVFLNLTTATGDDGKSVQSVSDFWNPILERKTQLVTAFLGKPTATQALASTAGEDTDAKTPFYANESDNPFFKLKDVIGTKIIFAFDEARRLLSEDISPCSFEILRNVLGRCFTGMSNMPVMIVADTNSTIANFAPPLLGLRGSPIRSIQPGSDIIPPFFVLSGHDLFSEEYLNECVKYLGDSKWNEFLKKRDQSPFAMMGLGSPLWTAYANYDPRCKNIAKLSEFADTKINDADIVTSDDAILAAIAIKVGLTVMPDRILARNFVAKHQALLTYFSKDRLHTYVSYPSDPFLALGADRLLLKESGKHLLEIISSNLLVSNIDVGDIGEFFTRFFVHSAFNYASGVQLRRDSSRDGFSEQNMRNLLKSVSVKSFLEHLLPNHYETIISSQTKAKSPKDFILDGQVFFNHTIFLQKLACFENLEYAFCRGAIIVGYPRQTGWDMCIPVVLQSGRLSAIYLQVKNWIDFADNSELDAIGVQLKKGDIVKPKTPVGEDRLFLTFNLLQGQNVETQVVKRKNGYFFQGRCRDLFKLPRWGKPMRNEAFDVIDTLLQNPNVILRRMNVECSTSLVKFYEKQDFAVTRACLQNSEKVTTTDVSSENIQQPFEDLAITSESKKRRTRH
jgi:hypothetical protein